MFNWRNSLYLNLYTCICYYFLLLSIVLICVVSVYYLKSSSEYKLANKTNLLTKRVANSTRTRVGTNSDWMSNLPENVISNTKLYQLVIPGSHASAAFDLDPNGGRADDFSYLDITIDQTERWFKTQNLDFMDQLKLGIRYFDLRIIKHPDGTLRFVHGLYGKHPVASYFKDIRTFLDLHPKEIVLLDFSHVYAIHKKDHNMLCTELEAIFEGMLLGKQQCDAMATSPSQMTLKQLYDIRGRVIIFYKDVRYSRNHDYIWTRNEFDILWPYTPNQDLVIQNLVSEFNDLYRKDLFIVWNGILTIYADHNYAFTMEKITDLQEYVSKTTYSIVEWITHGPDVPLNIVCADFVEEHNFVETVILSNFANI